MFNSDVISFLSWTFLYFEREPRVNRLSIRMYQDSERSTSLCSRSISRGASGTERGDNRESLDRDLTMLVRADVVSEASRREASWSCVSLENDVKNTGFKDSIGMEMDPYQQSMSRERHG